LRIKRITTLTVIILLVTTGLSIWLNIEIDKHYETLDVLDAQTHDLVYNHSSGILPINVFLNIQSQLPTDDFERQERLRTAYEANLDKIKDQTQVSMDLVDLMGQELTSFKSFFSLLASSDTVKSQYDKTLTDFRAYQGAIATHLDQAEWSADQVSTAYQAAQVESNNLVAAINTYTKDLRASLRGLIYLVTLLTVIELLILVYLIYRLVYKDLPFISKNFKKMEDHNYDLSILTEDKPMFREEKDIHHMIQAIFEEQGGLNDFKNRVMDTYLMDEMIDQVFDQVNRHLRIERVGIAFVDYSQRKIIAEYGVLKSGQVKLGPGFQVGFDKTSLTSFFQTKEAQIDNNLLETYKSKSTSGALGRILAEGLKSNMTVPLLSGNTVYGLLFFSSNKQDYFTQEHLNFVGKMAYEISGFLNRAYLTKVILSKITSSFAVLVDKKDNETGGHIQRMVSYSVLIAKALSKLDIEGYEVDKEMILNIERNAAIHDIGKVGIPDAILKKPGPLTSDEWEIMKTHATIGGDIFKDIREDMSMFDHDFYEVAEVIARYHHEKYDGTGYPEGLKGQEIPLIARIVACADVFDALTSKRIYKRAFTFEEAVDIIRKESGYHFDPNIVKAFDKAKDKIHSVYQAIE